jgi:hypothetical protein
MERTPKVQFTHEVPKSTVDGSVPDARCENCRYWGMANNLTVCRLKPGVPAMMTANGLVQCVSLFPPALPTEWCGSWMPKGIAPGMGTQVPDGLGLS